MFQYLSAIGFSRQVEPGRLQVFIRGLLRNPDMIRRAYIRADRKAMFSEKRINMGPFFVTLMEKTEGTPELMAIMPGVRELWGPVLENLRLREDERGRVYVAGSDKETGEPFTLMTVSTADLLDVDGRFAPGAERCFSCYGLSVEGKILLGSSVTPEDEEAIKEDAAWRDEVMKRAKNGDMSAFDEMERYREDVNREVRERLKTEDLYTVLDGFFTPVSLMTAEEDVPEAADNRYTVLGEILHVDKMLNPVSEEWVYRLEVRAMAGSVGIYINPRDLVGVPEKGRRFRGEAVLMGQPDPRSLLSDTDRGFF